MMNNRAFTLAELLIVIVIIALISTIATISYSALIQDTNTRIFENYMDTMHDEIVIYYLKNQNDILSLGDNENDATSISLLTMNNEMNVTKINNPVDSNDYCHNNGSYVNVWRDTSKDLLTLKYKVCLKCNANAFDNCKYYPSKYTIIFNSNGGSSIPNQYVNENDLVTKPSNPEKNGSTFRYWSLNGVPFEFTKSVEDNNVTMSGTITLEAVWN